MNIKKLFATLAAAFLFVAIFASISISKPVRGALEIVPSVEAKTATVVSAVPATPAEILIPTAHVDAAIIPVGVTATNNLDVPHNYTQVGWYKYGIMPGQNGTAVLDGHVDNGASIPGPFKHLRDTKVGDDITVITNTGTPLHYKVTAMNVYAYNHFPSGKIFAQSNSAELNIITCHGTFLSKVGTYNQRLVVTAELVS